MVKTTTKPHENISSGDLRRLADAAGIGRMSRNARKALIDVMSKQIMEAILKDAIIYMENEKRKTIGTAHIRAAFGRHGRHLAGEIDVEA